MVTLTPESEQKVIEIIREWAGQKPVPYIRASRQIKVARMIGPNFRTIESFQQGERIAEVVEIIKKLAADVDLIRFVRKTIAIAFVQARYGLTESGAMLNDGIVCHSCGYDDELGHVSPTYEKDRADNKARFDYLKSQAPKDSP